MNVAQWILAGLFWFFCASGVFYLTYVAWWDRETREKWRERDLRNPYFPSLQGADDPLWYAVSMRIFSTAMLVILAGFTVSVILEAID